jgi:hypothetical protein
MKAIKTIGLVALAALTATALVGVTSAMAETTVLCSADESPCAEGNVITHLHGTPVGKAKLLTSIGTVECEGLALGDVIEQGPPLILRGTSTFSNCELGGSKCTATEENGPAETKALKEGHETGSVVGEGLVHLVCGTSINCSYNGTGLKGTIKGPLLSTQPNGEVTISEASTTKEAGGFLCPKTSKSDGTATPLVATYAST